MPFGTLLALTALAIRPGVGGGNAQVSHGAAGRHEANLGVLPQVANQNDFVDATSHAGFPLSVSLPVKSFSTLYQYRCVVSQRPAGPTLSDSSILVVTLRTHQARQGRL